MERQKLESTRELQRIAALPFNPIFKQQVKTLRRRLKIPITISKSIEWFKKQSLEHGEKEPLLIHACFTKNGERDFIEPKLEARIDSDLDKIVKSRVPIVHDVLNLLSEFGLPFRVFDLVLAYVLTNDKSWIKSYLSEYPYVSFQVAVPAEDPQLTVKIRLSPWTTKKQWDGIWNDIIEKDLKFIRKQFKGMEQLARKRSTIEALKEQMERWSEWYQMVKTQGLSLEETANIWRETHDEEYDPAKDVDLSTISKAIAEFEQIIRPVTSGD